MLISVGVVCTHQKGTIDEFKAVLKRREQEIFTSIRAALCEKACEKASDHV